MRDAGVDALKALVVAVGQQSPPVAQCLAALGKHIVAKVLGAGGKLEPANELLNTAPVKGSKVRISVLLCAKLPHHLICSSQTSMLTNYLQTQSRATKKTPPAVKTATEDLLKTAPIKNSTNSEPRPDRPPVCHTALCVAQNVEQIAVVVHRKYWIRMSNSKERAACQM